MHAALIEGALWCIAAFALSTLVTRGAMAWALRRGMLDQPGQRRSHAVPTPRGGGLGLVAGALLVSAGALAQGAAANRVAVVIALCVAAAWVALTGWMDDRRPLPALPRLLMHLLAGALFAATVIHAAGLAWAWLPLWIVLTAWSINLHNFMDGIDGILGAQVVFVGAGLAVLGWACAQPALATASAGMAAAACGFLVYNWPPARVFMGDVGSGFAGFLLFALIALLCVRVPRALWPALLLCSAFVADAGLTLAWRMVRGARWYTAHREHVYQWLVRSGWSHARATWLYMLWNLLLAAPVAALATWRPRAGPWLCLALYAVAAVAWWLARGACLRHARGRRKVHVA